MKKPSGSFIAWENTLCNALDHPRIQSQNAWEDGYASGVAAEREAVLDTIDELMGMERERHPMFSEGYDHALLHLKEFVSARGQK